jgi:upstream activation factor subunit UAF30
MAQAKQTRAKPARTAKTPSPRRTGAAGADASKAVRGGIAQLVTPSPELGAIVGMAPLSRAELTIRVWAYIKAHELQDTQDRRQIHADATLKKVLGRDQVSMFEMTKLLNQHVTAARQ